MAREYDDVSMAREATSVELGVKFLCECECESVCDF